MSDVMMLGVLGMPWPEEWEAACPDRLWLMQFKDRLQHAREELSARSDRIAELEREVAALRKEAERYRFLRERFEFATGPREWPYHHFSFPEGAQEMDAAIDAALGSPHEPPAAAK